MRKFKIDDLFEGKTGDTDYEFMETYISALEKVVIRGVVEWKDRQINLTKRVVRVKV